MKLANFYPNFYGLLIILCIFAAVTQYLNVMIGSIIAIAILVIAIITLVVSDRKDKKPKLPGTILERIGQAAAGIHYYIYESGYSIRKSDSAIWNNASFIIAYLMEHKICSAVDDIYIANDFKKLYADKTTGSLCYYWLRNGVSFYRKEIRALKNGSHELPDTIIHNLIHPSKDKVPYDQIPMLDTNIIRMMDLWSQITSIMDRYFISDPEIKKLPLSKQP